MALSHFFLVDTGDSFFEEGGAGNGRWCPGSVATRTGVGKVSGCGGGRRGDIQDDGRSESEQVISPFLCR